MKQRSVWSTVGLGVAAAVAFASIASAAETPGRTTLTCEGRKGVYEFGITDDPLTLELRGGSKSGGDGVGWSNYFDSIENIAGSVFSTYDFAKTDVGYKFDRKETSRANGRVYQTYEVRFDLKALTFSMTVSGMLPLTEGIADLGRCKLGTDPDVKDPAGA